jgi:hypothetical protein
MKEAITALKSAKDSVADVTTITLASPTYATENDRLSSFFSDKVKKCFDDFQVRLLLSQFHYFTHLPMQIPGEFNEWHDKFNSGVRIDEDHLTKMRERLGLQ